MSLKVTRRFNPTKVELVNILRQRIDKKKPSSFITDIQNLYEKEPWLLPHVSHVRFYENEWFYFVTRKKRAGIIKADSKIPSRKVGGSGRWKTTGALTHIKNKYGVKIGSMKSICFKVKSETKQDGTTSGWVMHEFVLDKPGFQEMVLCRIRFYPRKDNAQYAPILTPIMIGLEREDGSTVVENNFQNLDAPAETHQAQDMAQSIGSCSGDFVAFSAPQHQQIMAQDHSIYPILNGSMEQHQDLRSYGQQHNLIVGHSEQYGQGFRDMVQYQNQYLGQETTDPQPVPMMMNQALNEEQQWNGYSGSSSAYQYLGQEMVLMRQCLMAQHQEQHLAAQRQQLSVNGSMEEYQYFGSSGQQQNHILGREATYVSLMEDQQQQNQNLFWRQETDPSHSAQAIEEQQQWNGYFGPYSAQPYDQGMMEHQDFGSSSLCLAQNHQYLRQNNDLSALGELAAQQQHLGEDSNLSLTQQQNQIPGKPLISLQWNSRFGKLITKANFSDKVRTFRRFQL